MYAYSQYGEATTLGPDGGNSLQYTGRENDGTGLYYYRARFYDPVLKRFVSEDPIALHAGPNFYAYVDGIPVGARDPLGLDPYLVGRPLDGIVGSAGFGHLFLVTDAAYLGDRNANVHSFGQMTGGGTGPVNDLTKGFSFGTLERDKNFWYDLGKTSCSVRSRNTSAIGAPDQVVRDTIASFMPTVGYGVGGINSNSASSAMANRAVGAQVPLPTNGVYPGSYFNYTHRFKK